MSPIRQILLSRREISKTIGELQNFNEGNSLNVTNNGSLQINSSKCGFRNMKTKNKSKPYASHLQAFSNIAVGSRSKCPKHLKFANAQVTSVQWWIYPSLLYYDVSGSWNR